MKIYTVYVHIYMYLYVYIYIYHLHIVTLDNGFVCAASRVKLVLTLDIHFLTNLWQTAT